MPTGCSCGCAQGHPSAWRVGAQGNAGAAGPGSSFAPKVENGLSRPVAGRRDVTVVHPQYVLGGDMTLLMYAARASTFSLVTK